MARGELGGSARHSPGVGSGDHRQRPRGCVPLKEELPLPPAYPQPRLKSPGRCEFPNVGDSGCVGRRTDPEGLFQPK